MKHLILLATFLCHSAWALDGSGVDNSFANYPPGCISIPELQTRLYGNNIVKVFEENLLLIDANNTNQKRTAIVSGYRVGCADANRSVVWIAFSIPQGSDPETRYIMPLVSFKLADGYRPYATLSREPDGPTFFQHELVDQMLGGPANNGIDFMGRKTWIYILEYPPATAYWDRPMLADEYNSSFGLQFYTQKSIKPTKEVQVPATASVLSPNPDFPLNGRLSGQWITEGAADPGFHISISELPPASKPEPDQIASTPLLLFFYWHTFGLNGEQLWLTGAAIFQSGDSQVTFSLLEVNKGEFLGSKPADRRLAGAAVLTGLNCNDLGFDYDLQALGLGSGSTHLRRHLALETAGHACRDLNTRISEVAP